MNPMIIVTIESIDNWHLSILSVNTTLLKNGGIKMKLKDLAHNDILTRPEDSKLNVADGMYVGEIIKVELVERECNYEADGKRVVLNFILEVKDEEEETVILYFSPNLSWSKRGKLMQTLEKLDALPKPGESIQLEELVGMSIQVIVENNEKDGVTYSNVISMERVKKGYYQ